MKIPDDTTTNISFSNFSLENDTTDVSIDAKTARKETADSIS